MGVTEELAAEAVRSAAGVERVVLSRYRLVRPIGSGGFGTVYEAVDERLQRRVAVKVIPADGATPERTRREALAAGRLDHPGIVAVYDAGEEPGARYLVSELVEGRTLARLEADGELSDRDVLRLGLALADALEHAHERGVIHRDVKPQNVIVPDRPRSRAGLAKLTDFGIAHLAGDEPLTRTGDVIGTLAYMAPEQAAGARVDERADLYSLALVLYEALSGRNPVKAATPAETARRLGNPVPALKRSRRDLPAELCDAIDSALRPRPEERGTLADLAQALAEALPEVSDEGGTIAPHPLEERPQLPPAAERALAGLGAAVLATLALQLLTPGPPIAPLAAGTIAALVTAALPRAGWIATAAATVVALTLAPEPRPGSAVLVAAGVLIAPLAIRGRGRDWSLPALAPALGFIGLAGAYPALAGRASSAAVRAALAVAGLWWLLLAEALAGDALLAGPPSGIPAPAAFDGAAGVAAGDVLAPILTSGALLIAPVWALAAVVLPWLIRGRSLAVDVVAATGWTAGLAAATASVTAALGGATGRSEPRGLIAGAIAAAVIAVARRR